MLRKTLFVTALTLAATGLGIGAAMAAPATTLPAPDLGIIYPSPSQSQTLPPVGSPGVTVVGLANCPSFLFADPQPVGFEFQSGNAVLYRISDGTPNGGNAEGIATLVDGSTLTAYAGQTHLWFGTNINPNNNGTTNQQAYFGETISFHGAAPDGSSITITANPGGNTSASGNQNGWGVLKVTCT